MDIYVKTKADYQTLKKLFEQYGEVTRVTVKAGFAFVTMPDASAARKAVNALNGKTLNNEQITVKEAEPPRRVPGKRNQQRGESRPHQRQQNAPPAGGNKNQPRFVNPYNFVPVKPVQDTPDTLRPFYGDNSHWQDRFREGTHSGRVVCELETEAEMFLGAGKKEKESFPAELVPFALNGRAAIPPSSLKGMLSSIMEAASNSALRVLDKTTYTRRHEFSEIMSKIGMVVERTVGQKDGTGQTQKYILPLKTANVRPRNQNDFDQPNPSSLNKHFPVYLNGYDKRTKAPQDLLENHDLIDFSSDKQYYYLDIRCLQNKVKQRTSRGQTLYFHLGYELACPQKPAGCQTCSQNKSPFLDYNGFPFLTGDKYQKVPDLNKDTYLKKGLFKILGVQGREKNMPVDKAHEFFLFMDKDPEICPLNDLIINDLIIIDEITIENFNILADERSKKNKQEDPPKARLPYAPKGRTRDFNSAGNDTLRLRPGDIVYYEASGNKATQVSFSACWRYFCGDTPDSNDAYGYFGTVDSNGYLLPPALKNGDPSELRLTAVSALMGFVEEKKKKEQASALTLAGRLLFSPGILSPEHDPAQVRNGEKILKILDSPKPPCPEFYFHDQRDRKKFIPKKNLKPRSNFLPNGRKFYWHHDKADPYAPNEKYIDDHKKQISKIRPIKENTKFLFTIDFFNLNDFELGMLLYALRPSESFRHLMGMGKPLGLGRVRIDILNLLFVDRKERYATDSLFDQYFFHTQTETNEERLQAIAEKWTSADARSLFEKQRFCSEAKDKKASAYNAAHYINIFKEKVKEQYGPDWLAALEKIGDPGSTKGLKVRYPPNPHNPGGFDEAFKWWVRNAGKERGVEGKEAVLEPIPSAAGAKAPELPVDPVRR